MLAPLYVPLLLACAALGLWLVVVAARNHVPSKPEYVALGVIQTAKVLELVRRRQRLLKDAWLTETGHKRPGMSPGVPLEEATRQAGEIDRRLRALLYPAP